MEKKPTRASTRAKATTAVPPATRTTRAAAKSAGIQPPATVAAVTRKAPARKPLANRNHSIDATPAEEKVTPIPQPHKVARARAAHNPSDSDREPIMAYLRIRPYLGDAPTSNPYLSQITDTSVRMADPHHDAQNNPSRFRPSTLPSSIYTFSHVFPPITNQSDFFTKTTLPLVRDVLRGQNGLLFTYGVTNSGKTYTVQGGTKEGSAGILPRTLDVIFNSIEGLHGDGKYRPVRLQGVELADPNDNISPQLDLTSEPALAEVLAEHLNAASDTDIDPTVFQVDRNYEYTIWLSYAEVYNEKAYDLLDSVKDNSHTTSQIPRANGNNSNHPLLLTRKALPLKASPPSESDTSGRYISGLRQFRVRSASQAKELVKLGQLHRRVFGTLANRESSRSHGMVIIKVMRGHRGERNDPSALQISRLTLVDLAGSERTKHTQTTGDRLKEAGNINKSLMVLGQCLEVMRANQRRLGVSLADGQGKEGRMDTREVKKNLAVVPFRHSKLTEALMDYFIGDGRAVMIVNVNPYDTGYDENSHVMKFAALAREVYITPAPAPLQRVPTIPPPNGKGQQKTKMSIRAPPEVAPAPYRRKVTISTGGVGGKKVSEAILEVLEEDEAEHDGGGDDDDNDNDPINPLVDALFDEIEDLRMQVFEAEMKCAIIEAETREEVMREMEERMRRMENMYARRLMSEVEQNEIKTDAKIDMLHQSGLFASPVKTTRAPRNTSEEDNVETKLKMSDENDSRSGEEFNFDSDEGSSVSGQSTGRSLSPLADKGKGKSDISTIEIGTNRRATLQFVPDGPQADILPSDEEEMGDLTETEDGGDGESVAGTGTEMTEETDEEENDEDYNDRSEEEWPVPPTPVAGRISKAKLPQKQEPRQSTSREGDEDPTRTVKQSARNPSNRLSKLAKEMNHLSLSDIDAPDDSVIILPVKKFRVPQESMVNSEDEEANTMKKRKRQLGKKPIITEEEIEKVAQKGDNGKSIRRMTLNVR